MTIDIIDRTNATLSPVDLFWGEHTVIGPKLSHIRTAKESEAYLKWRNSLYPLCQEFLELWGDHEGQTVLDFGCGPGTDTLGFLLYSKAARVIGVDVSARALKFAAQRMALHGISPNRVQLILSRDTATRLPLDDRSVDHIYCEGVLHHTTDPQRWLNDFYRVAKPGASGRLMVYNRESIWYHLNVAYEQMVLKGNWKGLTVEEAAAHSTDHAACPIARFYSAPEFSAMCRQAGFRVEYLGGYLAQYEADAFWKLYDEAVGSPRLSEEHKGFLRSTVLDPHGYPAVNGKVAGIGGSYRIWRDG